MSTRARRNQSPAFKAKLAMAAIKRERTIGQLAELFDVYHRGHLRINLQPTCLSNMSLQPAQQRTMPETDNAIRRQYRLQAQFPPRFDCGLSV